MSLDAPKPNGPAGTVNWIRVCRPCTRAARAAGAPLPLGAVQTLVLQRTRRFLGTDKWGAHKYGYSLAYPETPKCRVCQREMDCRTVSGKKSDAECNDKCLASTGFLCECSCGGKNHGRGYAAE